MKYFIYLNFFIWLYCNPSIIIVNTYAHFKYELIVIIISLIFSLVSIFDNANEIDEIKVSEYMHLANDC